MTAPADVDLVAVGGGLAGLVCALRAAELGLRAAVIEQGEAADYACNSRVAGGIYHLSYHDPAGDAAQLRQGVQAAMRGQADPALLDALIGDGARAIEWLRAHGMRFVRGREKWQAWVSAPPRPPSTWLDWKGRGQDVSLRALTQGLRERGSTLRLGTRALSLIVNEGRCLGVRVAQGGAGHEIHARAVVLADGGFQGDPALFRQYIGPAPEKVVQRGTGTGTGDGLRMARQAGAAITALNRFYGHVLSRDALRNDRLWPYPQIDAVAAAGIVVDREAKRFIDESQGGIYIANELATLAEPDACTAICDAAIWERAGREAQIPPNPMLTQAGGTLLSGRTLDELATAAALPAARLAATVAEYNARIVPGGRSMPIAQAPFFAIPICAGITYTMGGIAIDEHARVKHEGGGLIEGLYAAGSCTGGIEGGAPVAYAGGLMKAVVLGLRAAEHAARATTPTH